VTPLLDDSIQLRDGAVFILDRRVFPHEVVWQQANSAQEVAQAIKDMVTQSSGPTYAALVGLRLAARQGADLVEAAKMLRSARPTNNSLRDAVDSVVLDSVATVEESALATEARYRRRSRELAEHAVTLLDDGARILTHCWMDAYIIELVRAAAAVGKTFSYVATETRPYLQGARLTAHTLAEMGQEVTLITDGMAAAVLSPHSTLGKIDALVTAADRVSMDGHVFNKVGTLGAAVAARAFDVPYYALVQAPDPQARTAADVEVEERDGREVLYALEKRTASDLVKTGYYPAFDVTPPRFVTRIVTDKGAYHANEVGEYWA
jgi:methylthioribose-1-phosphate isomerase